jgi:AMP-polyphosphate phosphotransferase
MTEKFQAMDEEQLSLALIEAQFALRETQGKANAKSLLVLVNGIEFAGKGEAVKQLREWVDPRYLHVRADEPTMLAQNYPYWLPYVPFIPKEGQIVVLFGNWYTELLNTAMHASQPLDQVEFDRYVAQMRGFEQDLNHNHVDVVKVWFDVSWKTLQQRVKAADASELRWHKQHGHRELNKKRYDTVERLRKRFTQDWLVIDCEVAKTRDQIFAQHILKALQHCPAHPQQVKAKWTQAPIPQALLTPDDSKVDPQHYKKQLKKLSNEVANALRFDPRHIIICFEGMDAAGKGGAIKRIVKKLDPREYEIHSIAAPEPYELRRPYLWRFWRKLQTDGDINIFDRTWYGRVLVERVEGFAQPAAWQRAYEEINRFEKDLVDHHSVVIKFWLAIAKDEQAARFRAREETPHKRFKITEEDWRNRERWDDYLQAAADMFAHTDTDEAPWHIIATNDKKTARIQILEAILKQLKA